MGKETAILILPLLAVLFYVLYVNGWLIVNAKRAVMYVGSLRGRKAVFTSCTGYIKRVVKFRSGGTRHLALDVQLSQGELSVELLDSAKRTVARLDSGSPGADVSVERGRRYYLVVRFQSATGRYTLSWD